MHEIYGKNIFATRYIYYMEGTRLDTGIQFEASEGDKNREPEALER